MTTTRDESQIAAACDTLATACGYSVEDYSDTRRVNTTPGLPDRRYVHRGRFVRVWVELKAPGGKLTAAQHAFLLSENAAGGLATVIDDDATLRVLLDDLARSGVVSLELARRRCADLVRLCAQRGFRDETAIRARNRQKSA